MLSTSSEDTFIREYVASPTGGSLPQGAGGIDDLLAQFSTKEFSVKDWANMQVKQFAEEAKGSSSSLRSMDGKLLDLTHKLQVLSLHLSRRIERGTTDIVASVPRILTSIDLLEKDSIALAESMDSLAKSAQDGGPEELLQQVKTGGATTNPFSNLNKMDRVLNRMQGTKNALKEAETWLTLRSEVSSFVASGEFLQASQRLYAAQMSLDSLKDLPNNRERQELISSLKTSLISIFRDELVKVFNTFYERDSQHHNNPTENNILIDDLHSLLCCFVLMDELDGFINIYRNYILTPLKKTWNGFTLSEQKADNILEFTRLRGQGYTNWLLKSYMDLIVTNAVRYASISEGAIWVDPPRDVGNVDHSLIRDVLKEIFMYYVSQQQSRIQRYLAPPPDIDCNTVVNWPDFISMYTEIVSKCIEIETVLRKMDRTLLLNQTRRNDSAKKDDPVYSPGASKIVKNRLLNDTISLKHSDSVGSLKEMAGDSGDQQLLTTHNKPQGGEHLKWIDNPDVEWIENVLLPFMPLQEIGSSREVAYLQGYCLPFSLLESAILVVAHANSIDDPNDSLSGTEFKVVERMLGTSFSENGNSILDCKDLARLLISLPAVVRNNTNPDGTTRMAKVTTFYNFAKILETFLSKKLGAEINASLTREVNLTFGLGLPTLIKSLDKDVITRAISTVANIVSHFRVERNLTPKSEASNYYFVYASKKKGPNNNELAGTNTLEGIRANSDNRRKQKIASDVVKVSNSADSQGFYYVEEDETNRLSQDVSGYQSNLPPIEDPWKIFAECINLISIPQSLELTLFGIAKNYNLTLKTTVEPIVRNISEGKLASNSGFFSKLSGGSPELNKLRQMVDKAAAIDNCVVSGTENAIIRLLKQSRLNNSSGISEEILKLTEVLESSGVEVAIGETGNEDINSADTVTNHNGIIQVISTVFPESFKSIKMLSKQIQEFAFDSLFDNVGRQLDQFDGEPNLWIKESDTRHGPFDINLPQFNASPSGFITRIGESLLMLPQQLEQVISSHPLTKSKERADDPLDMGESSKSKTIHPLVYSLDTIKYLSHSEYFKEYVVKGTDEGDDTVVIDTEKVANFDSDDISFLWINALVQGLVEKYLWHVFKYILQPSLQETAATGQYNDLARNVTQVVTFVDGLESEKGRQPKRTDVEVKERMMFTAYGLEQLVTDMGYLKNILIALDVEPVPAAFEDLLAALLRIE